MLAKKGGEVISDLNAYVGKATAYVVTDAGIALVTTRGAVPRKNACFSGVQRSYGCARSDGLLVAVASRT